MADRKWTLRPGNIAALIYVTPEEGSELGCICLNEANVVVHLNGRSEEEERALFLRLPVKVQAEVNKHFGTVFALPVSKRDEYLKSMVPWDVVAFEDEFSEYSIKRRRSS